MAAPSTSKKEIGFRRQPFKRYFSSDHEFLQTPNAVSPGDRNKGIKREKTEVEEQKYSTLQEHRNKRVKREKTEEEKQKLAKLKKENAKKKREKKKRLIIRNLSFQIEEDELRKIFSQFGDIVELAIPKNRDGRKRGFAFVQYQEFKSAIRAIKGLNCKPLHGRPVAIDYAVSKSKYEHFISSRNVTQAPSAEEKSNTEDDTGSDSGDSEANDHDEGNEEPSTEVKKELSSKDRQVSDFLKELNFTVDPDNESGESDSSEKDDDSDDSESESTDDKTESPAAKQNQQKGDETKGSKKISEDTKEGRTVFVRNISFETSVEDFKEAIGEYGALEYCLLCTDPITEHPRGTAFVKFKDKADADKLIQKASNDAEEGLYLHGRRLFCSLALSRKEIQEKAESGAKETKDKRNLRLLKEGLLMLNSPEAEGVSQSDLAKRSKLEIMKKQKLKNLNFFVSETRLAVHNIPLNYTDKQLRKLFQSTVGKTAVITEARIMKDFQKVNEKGAPRSKGFGFVAFSRHEDALAALKNINNNPTVFSAQKRPIVEFSVESHLALMSQQRRRERNKLRNKRTEPAVQETDVPQPTVEKSQSKHEVLKKRNKRKKKQKTHPKKEFVNNQQKSSIKGKEKKNRESKPEKKRKLKKDALKHDKSFKKLVSQYKDKLLNKMN